MKEGAFQLIRKMKGIPTNYYGLAKSSVCHLKPVFTAIDSVSSDRYALLDTGLHGQVAEECEEQCEARKGLKRLLTTGFPIQVTDLGSRRPLS